jgi:hypothetical protein
VAQHRRSWPDGPACGVLIVVVVLLWLVNRFITHAFTATIILISASFGPSIVRANTEQFTRAVARPGVVRASTGQQS